MIIDVTMVRENTALGTTEFDRNFCAGIGPLQLGVVLVFRYFKKIIFLQFFFTSTDADFHQNTSLKAPATFIVPVTCLSSPIGCSVL